jgi:hypothetical protein
MRGRGFGEKTQARSSLFCAWLGVITSAMPQEHISKGHVATSLVHSYMGSSIIRLQPWGLSTPSRTARLAIVVMRSLTLAALGFRPGA